ncbi:alpha--glucanase [Moniliophthora roreri]|nr:alpha--glucanase [Moniliophthora roreri]
MIMSICCRGIGLWFRVKAGTVASRTVYYEAFLLSMHFGLQTPVATPHIPPPNDRVQHKLLASLSIGSEDVLDT